MILTHVLGGCCNMVHNREFPMNSVVLQLENGTEYICTNFKQSRKKPLQVYCYISGKWTIRVINGKLKHIMWDYHRDCSRKYRKCKANYNQLMRHDRKKKNGSGSRITTHSITDYECTKNPLHDFRKSYYI